VILAAVVYSSVRIHSDVIDELPDSCPRLSTSGKALGSLHTQICSGGDQNLNGGLKKQARHAMSLRCDFACLIRDLGLACATTELYGAGSANADCFFAELGGTSWRLILE
jgi:hypothetical protein